jgi:hypothetical protein
MLRLNDLPVNDFEMYVANTPEAISGARVVAVFQFFPSFQWLKVIFRT